MRFEGRAAFWRLSVRDAYRRMGPPTRHRQDPQFTVAVVAEYEYGWPFVLAGVLGNGQRTRIKNRMPGRRKTLASVPISPLPGDLQSRPGDNGQVVNSVFLHTGHAPLVSFFRVWFAVGSWAESSRF